MIPKMSPFRMVNIQGLSLNIERTTLMLVSFGTQTRARRGNRVNSVIPLNSPSSQRLLQEKKPCESRVGKIYNLLTHHIANSIYEQVPGLEEVYIWLLIQIGKPIDQPAIAVDK